MKPLVQMLLCLLLAMATAGARGGQGPETTLLVVNADSPLSLTVANRWMALRPIPKSHVVWLHDIPTLETLSMEQFRKRILEPIQRFMEAQGIDEEIDTIVYSADFPFAVGLRGELKRNGMRGHRYIGSAGSLTGLTYFANQVLDGSVNYLGAFANDYYRRQIFPGRHSPTVLSKEAMERQKQARKALKKGDPAKARELLEEVVETYATNAQLRILMAEILAQLGQHQAALQQLEEAHRLGWDNSLKLRNDKWLASLKKTEAFRKLLRQIEKPRARFEPPRGFRSRIHWSRILLSTGSTHDRYRLSALLAYTGQRGNSLPEIDRYLTRAAHSDASHPRGTVYLMENGDVRTETRQPWFGETCALLQDIGHRCQILTKGRNGENGTLPRNRDDIIGLVAGTRSFNWKRSGSQLLPGAIAEALTSYGGDFDNGSQTKLTEFLRQGAAGSSGAVVEPFAFPEKFPLPLMHYYYALGYSLAESWYMSVASPYQTILVGDPLAQPFADPVKLSIQAPDPERPWKGRVGIKVHAAGEASNRLDHYELWVDGRPVARSHTGKPLTWDTTTVADGYHELHLVAMEKTPREGRTSRRYWIEVDNHGLRATLSARQSRANYGTPFLLQGTAPPGSRISIRQGTRELLGLATNTGTWETILPTSPLGLGTVTLQAVAITPEGQEVNSNPLVLEITEPRPWRLVASRGPWKNGLDLVLSYRDEQGLLRHERQTLKALNGRLEQTLPANPTLEGVGILGQFRTDTRGFHQLAIRTRGKIEIGVDEQRFERNAPADEYGMVYVPLFLERGWHRLEIRPSPEGIDKLQVILGGEAPPAILGGKRLRSPKFVTE